MSQDPPGGCGVPTLALFGFVGLIIFGAVYRAAELLFS